MLFSLKRLPLYMNWLRYRGFTEWFIQLWLSLELQVCRNGSYPFHCYKSRKVSKRTIEYVGLGKIQISLRIRTEPPLGQFGYPRMKVSSHRQWRQTRLRECAGGLESSLGAHIRSYDFLRCEIFLSYGLMHLWLHCVSWQWHLDRKNKSIERESMFLT